MSITTGIKQFNKFNTISNGKNKNNNSMLSIVDASKVEVTYYISYYTYTHVQYIQLKNSCYEKKKLQRFRNK